MTEASCRVLLENSYAGGTDQISVTCLFMEVKIFLVQLLCDGKNESISWIWTSCTGSWMSLELGNWIVNYIDLGPVIYHVKYWVVTWMRWKYGMDWRL